MFAVTLAIAAVATMLIIIDFTLFAPAICHWLPAAMLTFIIFLLLPLSVSLLAIISIDALFTPLLKAIDDGHWLFFRHSIIILRCHYHCRRWYRPRRHYCLRHITSCCVCRRVVDAIADAITPFAMLLPLRWLILPMLSPCCRCLCFQMLLMAIIGCRGYYAIRLHIHTYTHCCCHID